MRTFLFDEFSEVSAKQWKQKIQFDLKGADYNETLVWESNEGIKVSPLYHQDNFEALEIPVIKKQYAICQSIFVSDEQTANFLAKDALKRGATTIQFEANEPFDILELFKELVIPAETGVHFKLQFLSESFLADLIAQTKGHKVFLNIDLVGNLAKSGNWFYDSKQDHSILENTLKNAPELLSTLSVDASLYQNAGANNIQQIAYALAHANEYLNHLDTQLDKVSKEQLNIVFNLSVGTNYFFEIAKLRALRQLWKSLASEYEVNPECHIFVTPSIRNKTIYDYNTNMLRTTTECMSAILGGADTINNLAYDAVYHKDNEFSERISRNQLLILKHESYFNTVNNPADGAYYIESLTNQITEKALDLFKDIEANNGFLNQLKDGTIQRKIKESATREQTQFDDGKLVLLGTNKHPNKEDKMQHELEIYPFVKSNPVKTLIEPIIEKRLSNNLDYSRIEEEKK